MNEVTVSEATAIVASAIVTPVSEGTTIVAHVSEETRIHQMMRRHTLIQITQRRTIRMERQMARHIATGGSRRDSQNIRNKTRKPNKQRIFNSRKKYNMIKKKASCDHCIECGFRHPSNFYLSLNKYNRTNETWCPMCFFDVVVPKSSFIIEHNKVRITYLKRVYRVDTQEWVHVTKYHSITLAEIMSKIKPVCKEVEDQWQEKNDTFLDTIALSKHTIMRLKLVPGLIKSRNQRCADIDKPTKNRLEQKAKRKIERLERSIKKKQDAWESEFTCVICAEMKPVCETASTFCRCSANICLECRVKNACTKTYRIWECPCCRAENEGTSRALRNLAVMHSGCPFMGRRRPPISAPE